MVPTDHWLRQNHQLNLTKSTQPHIHPKTPEPSESAPGTIRGDFALDVGRNICHGSDSVESANREIALWFPDGIVESNHATYSWIYEK